MSVGSKTFTESYVLGELMAQTLEARGFTVKRRHNLGATLICYEALRTGEIDLYPEYTGTISEAILKFNAAEAGAASIVAINERLAGGGSRVLSPFGFNNTYAFVVPERLAAGRGLRRMSDLAGHPDLRIALSYEFLDRGDGWRPLRREYRLPQKARGIEHGLAYRAIADGRIDVTDAYSTDAEIKRYDLRLLADDRGFFPEYLAVPFARADLPPEAFAALAVLQGVLNETQMQALNARVSVDRESYRRVAFEFLRDRGLLNADAKRALANAIGESEDGAQGNATPDAVADADIEFREESRLGLFFARLGRHMLLTALALASALTIALPLGVLVYRRAAIARPTLYIAGLLQTVPSIALLAFMIPLFGIGVVAGGGRSLAVCDPADSAHHDYGPAVGRAAAGRSCDGHGADPCPESVAH